MPTELKSKKIKNPNKLGWKLKLRVLRLQVGSRLFPYWGAKEAENIFLVPKRIPRPLTEKAFFDSAKKYEILPGIQAYEWGDPEKPLVGLFHGWSGRGTQMGAFAGPLVAAGFRVIAIDAPAHGDSTGEKLHVGLYANVMIAIENKLGPFLAVIGHSFGAGCLVVAKYRGLKARKIVLIAGPAKYSRVVDLFFKRSGLGFSSQKIFLENLYQMVGMRSEDLDIAKLGTQIDSAALIVHDENDPEVLYRSALEMHQAWRQSQLITTQGLGHRRILKDAAVVEKVLKFLKLDVQSSGPVPRA